MTFQRVFTDTLWEKKVGYCRALRHGDRVFVTGTASMGANGEVYGRGDGYVQAKRCLDLIREALADLGASMASVVRTRMFVTDIARWEHFGRAHEEAFSSHPPCTTMVEVTRLIHPAMLIEIEADAIVV